MIHTLAPPKVGELIGDVLVAPVQPWDALICTSPAVRECLVGLFERWQEYISHRFGAVHLPRPHLPLLPLGVDQAKLQDHRTDLRFSYLLRNYLRLNEHDVPFVMASDVSPFSKRHILKLCLLRFKKPLKDVVPASTLSWLDGSLEVI